MFRVLTRRRALGLGIVILVAAPMLVPLITLQGARNRILQTLQQELGRRVSADTVRLRLFPLPGVELDNVRLADAPAFGAEDMAVAADATAAVRLLPLLEGRLEFARVHLDQASINLVRNSAGRWNVAALLDGAGTAAGGGGVGSFPYVDWSDARINFKFNQTKTRFYLDQVEGSLTHDGAGWRLHADFVPQRTDLNLSDTGQITLDGQWPDAPGGRFGQRPFQMELRLSNSYLAGSSALFAGHDAGVHGIVSAQVHIQSVPSGPTTATAFAIDGSVQAQALRRWDLLPPPTTLNAEFQGVYTPAQDRFVLSSAALTPGRQVRMTGQIQGLFSRPSGDLSVVLDQVPGGELIPLLRAVKAGLPADLQASGQAGGSIHLQWGPGVTGGPSEADAALSLSHFQLRSGSDAVALSAAGLSLSHGRARILPTQIRVVSGAGSATMQVSAQADGRRFDAHVVSPGWSAGLSGALDHLLGFGLPWPADLSGTAAVDFNLDGNWSDTAGANWNGEARLKHAVFRPAGGPQLELSRVTVHLQQPAPPRIEFSLAHPLALAGTVTPAAGGKPVEFKIHAERMNAVDVWSALHPRQTSLMERVLGDVIGAEVSPWLAGVRAAGTVDVSELNWHGIESGVHLQLSAGAAGWSAPDLTLHLADGRFRGHGQLRGGQYRVEGRVDASRAIHLAPLLRATPYRGLLSGVLSGSLDLQYPVGGASALAVTAGGLFDMRDGYLATGKGVANFRRFSGSFQLHRGTAILSDVLWVDNGRRWQGQGTAVLTEPAQFVLTLHDGKRRRTLTGPLKVVP